MNLVMVCASASSTAIPSIYLVKKSTAKMIYRFPVRVLGSGPMTSIPICANGSLIIVAESASALSFPRRLFWQVSHPRT